MATIDEHRATIAALIGPVLAGLPLEELEARRTVDLVRDAGAGHGYRTAGASIAAPVDLPPFDNAQMDGFAVRIAEAGAPVAVGAPVPAGVVPPPLEPRTAVPVMTGSRIPEGADAVVRVEDIPPGRFPEALHATTITAPAVPLGTFVRPRGSDIRAGAELVPAGAALTPAVLGLLAASGVDEVRLIRRPRVLVVSTGSELMAADPVGATIGDANGSSLAASLAEVGASARAIRAPDDPALFRDALARGLAEPVDLIVTTGGISMGAFEVVRQALEPSGLVVTSVSVQPGGPQASGDVLIDGRHVPVVAFPGNPVSALVSWELFLRPLFAAHAHMPASREEQILPAAEACTSPGEKHQIRRGTVVDDAVRFVGGESSHLLAHYAVATHLVHIPIGVERVEPGDPVSVWRIR